MPTFGLPTGPDASWGPADAGARLAMTAGADPNGVFTSDLSVSEYALLTQTGYEPLGFVVGTSIYHIGMQPGRWSESFELEVLTQAMYNARALAMARMRSEAQRLNADGIVGVDLVVQDYEWTEDVLEFMATGTAVRSLSGGAPRPPDGGPFTSDLSTQDFYRLLATGAAPIALVLGTCVYHIAHQSFRQFLAQSGQNTEIGVFTQAVYEARELALIRMQTEAAQVGASGVVGVNFSVDNFVWGEHGTEFFATGTAIRRHPDAQRPPAPTFTLGLDE
jgi:uncharacterized protein YbjQ (UPF0145 family)